MVMQPRLGPNEYGERVGHVVELSGWAPVELSIHLKGDGNRNWITRMTTRQRKEYGADEWWPIANACAGRHHLTDKTPEEVFLYLAGVRDELTVTVRPKRVPSGGGGLLSVVESATSPRNTGRQTGGPAHSITRKPRAA